MGGAVLNEVPEGTDPSKYSFAGSTIVVQAASREEVKEILRRDIYAQSGVWDVENVSLISFSSFLLPYLYTHLHLPLSKGLDCIASMKCTWMVLSALIF
jgi:hypothetical protein